MKDIDLVLKQVAGLGFAYVILLDSICEARINFEMEIADGRYESGFIKVRALAGAPRKAGGKRSLDDQQEVFQRRCRAATYAQTRGQETPDMEMARRVLGNGVGNNVIRRFLAPDAWEVVEVDFQNVHWRKD